MRDNEQPISGWQLDQLYIGTLSDEERDELLARLPHTPDAQALYDQKLQDAEEIRQQPDFAAFVQQGLERLSQTPDSPPAPQPSAHNLAGTIWRWWMFTGMSITALAAMVIAFLPSQPTLGPEWQTLPNLSRPAPSPILRHIPAMQAKLTRPVFGMVHLRKGSRYSQWATHHQTLRPGDLIQFAYQMPTTLHLMIVGINNKGEVSAFFPLGGDKSVPMPPGKGTLPQGNSLELDDYIGQERLFMITSTRPFSFALIKRSLQVGYLRNGRELSRFQDLPGPWQVQSILIHKVPRHPTTGVKRR
jgi:hypothetical protein